MYVCVCVFVSSCSSFKTCKAEVSNPIGKNYLPKLTRVIHQDFFVGKVPLGFLQKPFLDKFSSSDSG